jgi:3-isopropylmalate dehydrogenase
MPHNPQPTTHNPKNILLVPGDGIGPEVVAQVEKIIDWLNANTDKQFTTETKLVGGAAYDEFGTPLPDETLGAAKKADAVLLGAVGGPKWESLPITVRPEKGLLGLRKELELFANLRPAICFDALAEASTLKREVISDLDIMIVRELTGGIYFGEPRGVKDMNDGQRMGYNTYTYTTSEVHRIGRIAFDLAKKRDGRVCSVDKANVLECTEMWREEMTVLHEKEYADCELSHMYVDNAAMQLVRNPKQFDVMVTGNMFGDILSDCAAMLTGSLGMLPSASLGLPPLNPPPAGGGDGGGIPPGMYEPVHGSAPDIAGQDKANPIATILSFAMMLRYSFGYSAEADAVEAAVDAALAKGYRTGDIMQEGMTQVGTQAMGEAILQALSETKAKAA